MGLMGWDGMGWDMSKKFFIPWDGLFFKTFLIPWDGILSKIFSSHGMG